MDFNDADDHVDNDDGSKKGKKRELSGGINRNTTQLCRHFLILSAYQTVLPSTKSLFCPVLCALQIYGVLWNMFKMFTTYKKCLHYKFTFSRISLLHKM